MTLTPEQIARGWRLHDGSDVCPIKDERTRHQVMFDNGLITGAVVGASEWDWRTKAAYRIIEAHGADAEPARPTPYPNGYDDLVFDDAGWSQTIIVDGKRPEWLRDDDVTTVWMHGEISSDAQRRAWGSNIAIRVRRREPKRETVKCYVICTSFPKIVATIDLIDGKPDLSTLKIAEDAL